jgi:hypothetical protein
MSADRSMTSRPRLTPRTSQAESCRSIATCRRDLGTRHACSGVIPSTSNAALKRPRRSRALLSKPRYSETEWRRVAPGVTRRGVIQSPSRKGRLRQTIVICTASSCIPRSMVGLTPCARAGRSGHSALGCQPCARAAAVVARASPRWCMSIDGLSILRSFSTSPRAASPTLPWLPTSESAAG